MNKRFTLKSLVACAILAGSSAGFAQDTIKIANIVEMSGPGTTSGVMFKNGVEMAIKEINAAGGILGKKITYTSEDTQTNPGVAKGLAQKAVDNYLKKSEPSTSKSDLQLPTGFNYKLN